MSGEDYLLSLIHRKTDSQYIESVYINQRACPFVKYYKDRLTVKYMGKGLLYMDITSIQSNKPANRDTLIYYYEVKVKDIGTKGDMSIGLADSDFPLNKHPGWTKKSFGYKADGKVYTNKVAAETTFPKFTSGCVVGCGINYLKREIFFTFNGEYLGAPFKDIDLKEYYATIGLHSLNECVTFNFGSQPFKFNLEKLILDEKRDSVKNILKQPINHYSLHQIVHSYLNFHGYVNTLEAFEKAAQIERRDVGLPRREVFEEPMIEEGGYYNRMEEDYEDGETRNHNGRLNNATDGEMMEIETTKHFDRSDSNGRNHFGDSYGNNHGNRYRSESMRLEFESPNFTMMKDHFNNEIEPLVLNSDNNSNSQTKDFVLFRKASLYVDPESAGHSNMSTNLMSQMNSHATSNTHPKPKPQHNGKPNAYLIQERAQLRDMILAGKITDAMNYINKLFPTLLQERIELLKILHAQQFIELVKEKDFQKAISFAQQHLTPYQKEKVYCLNDKGVLTEVSIDTLMALLCYPDPENSELKNFLTLEQRDLTADIANKEILSKMGFIDKSILDILIAQVTQTESTYRQHTSYYGEVFEFGV